MKRKRPSPQDIEFKQDAPTEKRIKSVKSPFTAPSTTLTPIETPEPFDETKIKYQYSKPTTTSKPKKALELFQWAVTKTISSENLQQFLFQSNLGKESVDADWEPPEEKEEKQGYRYRVQYPTSQRHVTRMTNMCAKKVNKCFLPPNKLYLPVVRYSGLFYDESSSRREYCGKFYYVDPESHVLLELGNFAVFGSKVHAYFSLAVNENETIEKHEFDYYGSSSTSTEGDVKSLSKQDKILLYIFDRLLERTGWRYAFESMKVIISIGKMHQWAQPDGAPRLTDAYKMKLFDEYMRPFYFRFCKRRSK